jgi:ribonuclease T2
MKTRHLCCTVALALALLLPGIGAAKSRKKPTQSKQFSYYMLVLSYAPDFCDEPGPNKTPQECGPGRRVGFVVHGLWPQGDTSKGPENCKPVAPIPPDVIQATLKYVPTESLIQHEWIAHGTCSGMSPADYFAALRKARDSVSVPSNLDQPAQKLQTSPVQIESELATANASFPKTAFRTACYNDRELQDLRVCFDKNLSPRACGPSAGECRFGSVVLLPVR